ncbi:MAG: hypothetical protein BA870_10175 [Desulfuromonadales bacterium C00003094]|nr:MAG: hypothetical protein BA870_10175 [Desulfuromonadales bacterium C00003094]
MVGALTIAKWELLRSRLDLNARSLLAICGFVVLIAVIASQTSHSFMSSNIYTVALDDTGLMQILDCDARFDTLLLNSGAVASEYPDFDLLIIHGDVYVHDSEKSTAALDALNNVLKRNREITLSSYSDLNNSFPVWVTIHYMQRAESFRMPTMAQREQGDDQASGAGSGAWGDDSGDSAGNGQLSHETYESEIEAIIRELERSDAGNSAESDGNSQTVPDDMDGYQQLTSRNFFEKQTIATPSNIEPPIPFTSVIFAFIFMFPMYFVAQFYSASIMSERTNRNGEFLLVSPLKKHEIVIGKTLPYLIITIVLMLGLAAYLKFTLGEVSPYAIMSDSLTILAIMLPVVLLFLSFSFISSILARSFKELTFVTVFFSTIVSGYLFFPAMFAHIHAIALISPMTLVVKVLSDDGIQSGEYLFSTLPLYCVSIATFGFGTMIFREEDLFTQKSVKSKIIDCMDIFLRGKSYIFLLTLIAIPFAYMLELMLIVLLFNIPLPYSIVVMIGLAALVEETFKSIGVYALSLKGDASPITTAVLAGSGFFLGEKLMMLVTVSTIAESVFGSVISMGSLLIYPLLLHIGCVAIVSFGLRYRGYAVCLLAATAVHSAYNLYLLRGFLSA